MKINASGLDQYQQYVKSVKNEEKAGVKLSGGVKTSNTDKVVISEEAAAKAEASRVSAALTAEVEGAASPERLAQLTEAVRDGSYHVASEDIADAILERLV